MIWVQTVSKGHQQLILAGKEQPTHIHFISYSFHALNSKFDSNEVFYLVATVFALRDQLLLYNLMNSTNESEIQNDISIFLMTTKNSVDPSIFSIEY